VASAINLAPGALTMIPERIHVDKTYRIRRATTRTTNLY